ncbi:MAG: DNA/RNA non-specific endonuclease [Bacteroidota bacterium]
MAKFRTNHSQNDNGMIYKAGIFAFIVGILYWGFSQLGEGDSPILDTIKGAMEQATNETDGRITDTPFEYFLPTSTTGQVIEHKYYTLSYSEKHEQPEWVAYELTVDRLNNKVADRTDNFRPDPKVKTKSATPADYRRSGYTRGHLAPAGDMGFSEQAMSETFYMSNMSPQVRSFNMGVWRELEEQTRDWARKYKHLYIVTGPILTEKEFDRIGKNIVTVPRNYYKVILDVTEPEYKGIGFIIPNAISDDHLTEYVVTIDDVEEITGIDFFSELLSEDLESELEGYVDVRRWKFSEKRYQQRVRDWNNR